MSFEEPKFVYKQKVKIISGFFAGQEGEVKDMFLPYGTNTRLYSIRNADGDLCHKIKEYELEAWALEVAEVSVDQEPEVSVDQEPEELTWWAKIWRTLRCIGL